MAAASLLAIALALLTDTSTGGNVYTVSDAFLHGCSSPQYLYV
jgi:hypothetical protein